MEKTIVLDLSKDKILRVSREGEIKEIEAKAVVLAMGCRERTRGALSIPGHRPAGAYTAGTVQNLVNHENIMPGKHVVILGSGDIGLIMARRMTLEGAKVEAVFEVLPYSSGLQRNIRQCLDAYGIPLYLSTTVIDIYGPNGRVEGVTVAQVDEKRRPIAGTERVVPCDTLLLSVGLIPENELTREAEVCINNITQGADVDDCCMTKTPGVFACGNVLHVHDLVDFVSMEAERAGRNAARYVAGELCEDGKEIAVKPGDGTPQQNGSRRLGGVPRKGRQCRLQLEGAQNIGGAGAAAAQRIQIAPVFASVQPDGDILREDLVSRWDFVCVLPVHLCGRTPMGGAVFFPPPVIPLGGEVYSDSDPVAQQ